MICSDLRCSYMDTYIMLHVIKVPVPLFTHRFGFGDECVICRKKKLRKVEVVMNNYNNASLNLEPKPCQLVLTKVMMSIVKLILLAYLYQM